MKIEIRGPAFATRDQADETLADADVLSGLDGAVYESDEIGNYLDIALVEIGVVGGRIRCACESIRGLEIVIDFWAPRSLSTMEIEWLANECVGQMSDGIGEGGIECASRANVYLVATDWSLTDISIRQFEDGALVAPPPRIAMAAMRGDLNELARELNEGGDCNQIAQRLPAVDWAILYRQPQAAILLLERGANPNAPDFERQAPLTICALSQMSDEESLLVARALLQRGADLNYSNNGWNALHFAENRKKPKLAEFLKSLAT